MDNKMTKAETQELLLSEYKEENCVLEVWQDRPWTAVKIRFPYTSPSSEFLSTGIELGFSKVCRPDKWDAQRGIDLAVQKAIAKIAKKLAEQ